MILRRLSDGKYLPKSIHVSRLKKGHVRARVNTWDPIPDVQGQELTEDDLPGNSLIPTQQMMMQAVIQKVKRFYQGAQV